MILLGSLLATSCSEEEQVLTGTIVGLVTEQTNANQPIEGASVTLSTKGIAKTTGSDGRYEMTELKPGTYTLQVQADGYQTTTKQVTVLAGETVRCDFQLQPERVNVEVTPLNLVFGKDVSQLSFSIVNNGTRELSFNITNLIKGVDAEVTPLVGTIKARATQMVNVFIKDRDQLRKNISGQLLINVGNTTQTLNITVEGIEEEKKTTGSVTGFISDFANPLQPIGGATVSLISTGQTQTTGNDGRYEFKDLAPDTYTLTVRANEYETATKQVKVEAGKTTVCDFQLQKGAIDVEVTPLSLTFASDVDQLSFIIKNNSATAQQYGIANVPDFVTVSQSSGMVAAKGSQAISVNVLSRTTITTTRSGQLMVNVGNSSFIVQLTVEPYKQEPVNIELSPQSLTFDKETSQLSFTVFSKTGRTLDYTVANTLQDLLTVSPVSGSLPVRGSQAISVGIKGDRKSITSERNGVITIAIEGNTYNVNVKVEKYEENVTPDPDPTPSSANVTRGLVAYYNFDKGNADDSRGNYHGFASGGSFITDTPNGNGKALYLKQKQYINVGSAPLDGRKNYTVSLWVKDFGAGVLMKTAKSSLYTGPTLLLTENVVLRYFTGQSNYSGSYYTFGANLSNYQVGEWVMITIVTEDKGAYNSLTSTLYINGRKADAGTSNTESASGGTSMVFGGQDRQGNWSDAMKMDNIRLYNVALTEEEVEAIYNYEK